MTFNTAQLLSTLAQFPTPERYWIAFSGGLDSTVLLHAMTSCCRDMPVKLAAVHIDHGLQTQSQAWREHCEKICAQLNIPCTSIAVTVDQQTGKGVEAAARAARYQAFASIMQAGDVICLAQHQDDQAETLLLQLLRGTGVAGLAAMPVCKPFAQGHLLRPLLQHSRNELQNYAEQYGLSWIDDPSNDHTTFDRNYLRHEVMPLLKQRWPAADSCMARAAGHLAEADSVLQEVATQDWQLMATGCSNQISITALQQLSQARQRNLIRHWIHRVNHAPLPDTKRLQQIFDEVIAATQDAQPCVQWHTVAIRRFQQHLYVTASDLPPGSARDWNLERPLELPELCLRLTVEISSQGGLSQDLLGHSGVRIGFRSGGEVCRPLGRGGHQHELRKLFQEWGVPPWQRQRVPLLYVGEEIAAVVGYCLCEGFAAAPSQAGIGIKIEDLSGDSIARKGENNDNSQD